MPQRVLVIDDAPQIHRLVRAWLKADGIDVIATSTADQGHALAATIRPDLILLDVDLPDVSGFELCRRLKSDEACCGIPIVFLTGANNAEDRVAGLNLGAADYIVKPFHPAEFQARVRATLRTKQIVDLLQHRAQMDGLTGLRNRTFLDERLKSEIAMVRRHERPFGCVMIDVDHFKDVNDRHGHAAGDDVLRAVAGVLLSSVRAEDVVARYGGEEFTILTPGVESAGAAVLAERARQAVAALAVMRGGITIGITCSFGVAGFDRERPSALLQDADAALYAAKTGGRNRVEVFDQSRPGRRAA